MLFLSDFKELLFYFCLCEVADQFIDEHVLRIIELLRLELQLESSVAALETKHIVLAPGLFAEVAVAVRGERDIQPEG